MNTAFLMTTFAGLSTLIGTIFIFIKVKNEDNILIASLSFAAGVMLTVSFSDLLPESFSSLKEVFYGFPALLIMLIFYVVGILISMFIDKKMPSESNNHLKRVGLISMLAIILHNIPEGIATYLTSTSDMRLGIALTSAIALHNIPEGISISVPIYYATRSRFKAFGYTLISGLSEPLGAILAALFLSPFITPGIMGILYAIIAGIMTHISIYELLPTSLNYKNTRKSLLFFFIGIFFMLGSHILFS